MKPALIVALSGLVATATTGGEKKEAPVAAPPEVYVADVTQKEVLPPELGYEWADMSYQEKRARSIAGSVDTSR